MTDRVLSHDGWYTFFRYRIDGGPLFGGSYHAAHKMGLVGVRRRLRDGWPSRRISDVEIVRHEQSGRVVYAGNKGD